MRMCLSEFLQGLDFLGAKKSSEYVGTKVDNPAMVLEENISSWTRLTSLEDLQECFRIFEEKVCVPDFPERYSSQFWLAHATLTTIYSVMSMYLETHFDEELKMEVDQLLFDLWVHLLAAGPGSSHLEMMDIILKYPHYPLWKYMQTLHGDNLKLLVSSLRTDFVYSEAVPADHYATLMETHIDKIFKVILRSSQIEEARRELLDLYAFYLTRMNHVPPHIGPRLSHLCFLIGQRYELENPYMGRDDWVLMRNHLKVIKDIITDPSFTLASEAQYRAPLTLEKIFQAVVEDKMLDIMFKDLMSLLLTICNHGNSKKCKRLFVAYQTGLFEQIDFKKGFDVTPNWMFDQCIQTLGKLSKTMKMETHIDELMINAQNLCLLKFTQLSSAQISGWHELMVNYIVSGRTLLVREAGNLLSSPVLKENNILNWKTHVDQGRLLIDIVTDVPGSFIQVDESGNMEDTLQGYVTFLQELLAQIRNQEVEVRVRPNVHKCLLKCMEKDPPLKALISLACINSDIPDMTDVNFMKDVLFSVDTLFKDEKCPGNDITLTKIVTHLLQACLQLFRSKGYIPVDVNSLLMSVCLSSLSAYTVNEEDPGHVTESCDMWTTLYERLVIEFFELHMEKGTVKSMASLVQQVILVIQDNMQRMETIPVRCVNFLYALTTRCFQLISDHINTLLEVFLDWKCYTLSELLVVAYQDEPGPFLAMFQEIFSKTLLIERDQRHHAMIIVEEISKDHSELFMLGHTCQLLGTYSTETERTKYHILNIIHNIVRKSPGHVATYFTLLIDDTKFPPECLPQKAPILHRLTQYSEDISQRVLDYLMKHLDSRTESVSLVAMETLMSLIKDKPGYIHKQKGRFKNVWKSSNSERVKQLCAQLVPEIKANTRKPGQKISQNTPQTAVSKEKQKMGPILNRNTRYQAQVLPRPRTSDREPKTTVSSTSKLNRHSSMTKEMKGNTQREASSKEKVDISQKVVTSVREPTKSMLTNVDQMTSHPVKPIRGANDGAGDKVLNTTDKQVLYGKTEIKDDGKSMSSVSEIVGLDADNNRLNREDNSEKFKEHTVDEVGGIPKASGMKANMEKASTDVQWEKENPSLHTGADTNGDQNIGKFVKIEPETVNLEKTLKESVKPSVCLCSCAKVKHLIELLSEKLRQAGYDNTVTNTPEEMSENMIAGAKVVIVCLDGFEEVADNELIEEVSQVAINDIPMIALKFQNALWPQSVQAKLPNDANCIRLYSKPGENKLVGTNWAKYKFCEVLMHLSYLGILPDTSRITNEFESLWERHYQPSAGQLNTNDGMVVPDIFMSYHWGKLKQVEPLYDYLMGEKYCCWLGAYQMKGTESLYNKIQQGLQCCRVVLACITNNYHMSEICHRDIKTAKQLDRTIIPVLIGNCTWPLGGDIGQQINKCKPVRFELTQDGCIDIYSAGMSSLLARLQQCLMEEGVEKELDIPAETDKWRNNMQESVVIENVNGRHSPLVTEVKRTVRKTTSMYEVESDANFSWEGRKRHYSNLENRGGKRRDFPDGVLFDENGYAVRSSRSKSCIIL